MKTVGSLSFTLLGSGGSLCPTFKAAQKVYLIYLNPFPDSSDGKGIFVFILYNITRKTVWEEEVEKGKGNKD